jgi:hypothetical protein
MTEERFTEELQRRAEDVRGSLSLTDVRTTAHSIRRRRAAATGAVAAIVAAAIIVPATLIGGAERTAPEPAPAPPSETAAPSETTAPSGPSAPASSVLSDGLLTRPDGTVTPLDLDTANLQQFGVLADGRVVAATSEPYAVLVYGADGQLDRQYAVASNAITMSADDTLVAWLDANFRVTVLESGVDGPTTFAGGIPMPGESPGSIDAVLGSGCATGGCRVLGGDYVTTTTQVTLEDSSDIATSEPLRIESTDPSSTGDDDVWAVSFPPGQNEQFGCSGLYDPAAGEVVARNCDVSVTEFSPDGSLLTSARGDNAMAGSVQVLDRDLEVVLDYTPESGSVVKTYGWADANHLWVAVSTLEKQAFWFLRRVPVDATGGEVVEVVEGAPGPNPEEASLFAISD